VTGCPSATGWPCSGVRDAGNARPASAATRCRMASRLPLGELIGARRPLTEVNAAYDELRTGGAGRTILLP
jgi:Zn-dependent alcohol dehydrogenase